ncbi:hypothetical protein HYQ40_09875 [Aerococcaceae bacterium DSM 111021]|nr:hypothetical protein [Aerococcaceae bacterium DSM 111021]
MTNTEQLSSEFYLITIIAKVKLADKIDNLFHTEGTSGATTYLAACYDEDDRKSILDMQGQRKEIIIKATHKDQLQSILDHIEGRYPKKDHGESFLFVTRLAGLAGLEGFGDIEDNTSFKNFEAASHPPYKMVTVICDHGEGEDYIDATQREDILQHALIKGHGSAKLSENYEGRYFQPEKDIVMQIVSSENVQGVHEFAKAYEGIQFSKAGSIIFTRDIVYLHRF